MEHFRDEEHDFFRAPTTSVAWAAFVGVAKTQFFTVEGKSCPTREDARDDIHSFLPPFSILSLK